MKHFLSTGEKLRITGGKWKGLTGNVVHEFKTGSYRVELDSGIPGWPGKKVIVQRYQAEPLVPEIRIDHAPVVSVLIEYRRKGSDGEWWTWVHLDEDDTENWVYRKLGRPDSREHLEFRLLRRTALVTDEVLDTEGE